MGNRGEDAARQNGAWGRQPPRESSSGTGAGEAGAWDDRSRGYWQDDNYPPAGGAGSGYGPDDGYQGQGQGYGQDDGQYGRHEGEYGQADARSGSGWGGNAGYEQQPGQGQADGYGTGAYAPQPGYRSEGQPRIDGGYPAVSGGYPALPGGTGGYPALPQGSGGYPALPQGSGGYPEQDAGNDWYGGQPAAANGASFADTGTYRLNGRIIDEYGTGPRGALNDGHHGTGPGSALNDGDPARGQRGHGTTGGYPVVGGEYDDHRDAGGYQAPGGYDNPGYDDYGQPVPYEGTPGGDRGGYENYSDYGMAADAYPERYDAETDSRGGDRGGRGAARSGRGGRSGARRMLLAALAVVVVGIAGVAAYVFVLKPKSPAAISNASGPLPTGSDQPSQQACVKHFCHIELRLDDPAALTTTELFPPAFTSEADKISYQLVTTKVDKTCSNAVIGPDLSTALKKGKCTQVLRATYVSGDGKIMGTIGVVNLATTNQAHYAGKVVGETDFIAPLTSAKGVTSKLGKGTGVVEAQFKGHYLILTWSEFVGNIKPKTSAQDKQLEQFGSDLVSGSANISLTQRMVNGAPSTPGAANSVSNS